MSSSFQPLAAIPPPAENKSPYYIKSQLDGLVLDVEWAKTSPGALVSMWKQGDSVAQCWYDHPETGTIRSMLNEYCLDIEGGRLVLNPYQEGKEDQQWERGGKMIVNLMNHDLVLAIAESDERPRAKVIKSQANRGSNQIWIFESASDTLRRLRAPARQQIMPYYIKSQLNWMVLDVEWAKTSPGALVSMWEQSDSVAQCWYDHAETGTIRSVLNSYCMDIEGGRLVLNPYLEGKEDQQWERDGNLIVNRKNRSFVLDIAESDERPRARVIKSQADHGSNQIWIFESASDTLRKLRVQDTDVDLTRDPLKSVGSLGTNDDLARNTLRSFGALGTNLDLAGLCAALRSFGALDTNVDLAGLSAALRSFGALDTNIDLAGLRAALRSLRPMAHPQT